MGSILSVYIENEIARVCEMTGNNKSVTVKNVFEVAMPDKSVEDGMIMDVEDAASALYAAFRNNNIKRGKIAFVISSRKIANKEIVIPYMKNVNKVEEVINANIDEYFPMNNLNDYIIKYTILDVFETAEGKFYSILVMAFQKEMVEGYYQLANMLKMPVETVEYYGNSIYQLLMKQLNQGTVLALQMDRNNTYVSIMNGKTQLFKRSVPYGRDTIIRNLAEFKRIDEEEAEEIITDPRKLDMELTPDEYMEIIRDFTSSVTRVVEFHTSRNPKTVIEMVKVMGSGIDLIGFTEILNRELGVDVTFIKELAGVKINKKNSAALNYEKIVDYLPNIGAIIAPLDLKVEEEKAAGKNKGAWFYILLFLAILANAGVAAFFVWQYQTLTQQRDKLKDTVASMQTAQATYETYTEALSEYKLVKEYYDSTKNNSELLYQLIVDLEEVMPESVGITNLSVENGNVSVTGVAGGKDMLAKFIIELKKLPYVTAVHVENENDTYDEFGRSTAVFNMTFALMEQETEEADAENNAEGGTGE